MERKIVLSASRRTDLVACYPDVLVSALDKRDPESVHSVVIWTKNPRNMIAEGELKSVLKKFRQVFVHLTITGMGGGDFEPGIPPWRETAGMIGPLVELLGSPSRIAWRFDPILEVEATSGPRTNFPLFAKLLATIGPFGIPVCKVSWVYPYRKVTARLRRRGWCLIEADPERRSKQASEMQEMSDGYRMRVETCSMDGFPVSRCIDGEKLNEMHPTGAVCSTARAKGQRLLCGCTESLDIGSYALRCRNGCIYCYAC
ncbi:MAG TPA: DUF1848 family protein [Thermodesulfobacteriota bacterium]|nr:DUF1848 family protein [Thermodesulfobacteriota bacterium]